MNSFFRKFADFLWQQIAVGLALSAAILFFQVHAGLISGAAINASWTALLKPYALVLFLIFIWHFFRTAYVLHVEDHTRHELQSAEIKLLQAELLKAKVGAETRVTAKDWTELADRMEQRCRFLRIDCQWSRKRERIWELKGGHGGVCDGLIRQAGNMLLNSPRVKDTLSEEVKGEMDAFQRWARYMNEKSCFETDNVYMQDEIDGEKVNLYSSSTRDLWGDLVRLCMMCAAIESS